MELELNKKYLLTTDQFFMAPDGHHYNAVHGTVTSIESAEQTLGIKTNAKSTNWYILIGNMLIAGCQVFYCVQTDEVVFTKYVRTLEHEGKLSTALDTTSRIYNADQIV